MRIPRRPPEEVSFQLAPMIDMTFLLLVFFMVTNTISREQVRQEIRLPVAAHAAPPKDPGDRDMISIDESGQLFAGNRPMDRQQLGVYLRQRFRDYPPLRLYIRADRSTPAARVKEIMRMAAEAGAIDVIFGTYQKEAAR